MSRRLLAALCALLPLAAAAQAVVTAPTVTVTWNAVTADINNNSLVGVTITYKLYGSQGCGTKTLITSTTATSVQIPVAPGCYSLAVSASDAAGEGAVSATLTLSVKSPQAVPAQVQGTAASSP